MAEEKRRNGKHFITMEDRERIVISGVVDVLSFDEEAILADTERGMLLLRGNDLHVGRLNLDDGEIMVDGMINSLEYNEDGFSGKGKGSFWQRLLK